MGCHTETSETIHHNALSSFFQLIAALAQQVTHRNPNVPEWEPGGRINLLAMHKTVRIGWKNKW